MTIPYCGAPPVPDALAARWNLDPVLIAALLGLTILHLSAITREQRRMALIGWTIAAAALLSPLCALSVSLFSARVGQHMILVLVAAPLIGQTLPRGRWRHSPWWSAAAFTIALWLWHMPAPYDATFHSTAVYWSMHGTLFGSAVWLWHDILGHDREDTLSALGAGTAASIQMAFLGAMLSLSSHALFSWHYTTTEAWGLSPIEDQQLGGSLMWVPGGGFFLWAVLRSLALIWRRIEGPAAR
jgi:putative membrane protein